MSVLRSFDYIQARSHTASLGTASTMNSSSFHLPRSMFGTLGIASSNIQWRAERSVDLLLSNGSVVYMGQGVQTTAFADCVCQGEQAGLVCKRFPPLDRLWRVMYAWHRGEQENGVRSVSAGRPVLHWHCSSCSAQNAF